MRYQVQKDGKSVELPVHVSRAEGVQEVYAHGAAGGPLANYHFRIDFYKDAFPPIDFILLGGEISEKEDNVIERQVVASICVPMPLLKELRNWLSTRIEEIEKEQGEIKLPIGTVEESSPKAKEA